MQLLGAIKKEVQLLLHDKIGLLLLYLMPILLVFVITIVQDSTFRLVNDNQLKVVVVNNDSGAYSDSLISSLEVSKKFDITILKSIENKSLSKICDQEEALIAITIPSTFSKDIAKGANGLTSSMLSDFGIGEKTDLPTKNESIIELHFDPVLQDNFKLTITHTLQNLVAVIENKALISHLYSEMGVEGSNNELEQLLKKYKTNVSTSNLKSSTEEIIPNSTQHNVPAWSLFAMFFMVISLGGSIVKERNSGSFVRLQTIPGSFIKTLFSKQLLYFFVAMTQLTLLFLIGVYIFPLIGLPQLNIPSKIFPLIAISFLSALAAISYAFTVGTFAKTQEQANGFGAISIIIFAAIGGVWVPTFVMPEYLQEIGKISPLRWCLDGFYGLFLKNGNWSDIKGTIYFLILFTFAFQGLTLFKLRKQNYL